VVRILDRPVAVGKCQWRPGKEEEAHTCEVMSEINADNYEHRKDLQYKESPDDDPDDLFMVSRTTFISVSTAPLTCGSKRVLALPYVGHTQIYLLLPQRVDT
jgi:hypothetical protein